jgi:phytanoyl-CoA hydroxylase
VKPPERVVPKKPVGMSVLVGETPWHQDNAVLTEDADESNVLTVWIPLVDATIENGCLIVIPKSHIDPKIAQHCPKGHGVLQIPDSILEPYRDRVIPVPLKRGGVLIFHRRLMHASLPNTTDDLRSSLDLRYQPLGQPTGREVFPGFVARSSNIKPLQSRDEWERLWKETQKQMSLEAYSVKPFDRWDADHPLCA